MKKLKVKNRFRDKLTGETHIPPAIIERNNERATELLKSNQNVVEEVEGTQDLVLDELSVQVSKASAKELDSLEKAEKEGSDRVGASQLFEKRRSELEAETTAATTTAPAQATTAPTVDAKPAAKKKAAKK